VLDGLPEAQAAARAGGRQALTQQPGNILPGRSVG